MPRNGYGHMVLDDYVAQVRAINADRAKRLASIRTKREAFAYRDEVREAIDRAYRPWPRKTPLNARVVGVVERRDYRIEKVLFESRPGCLVTAHLYVPAKLDGPAPGVIGSCGHAAEGKNAPLYPGILPAVGAQWLCRVDLRSLQPGRAGSVLRPVRPRKRAFIHPCPQHDGQATRTRGPNGLARGAPGMASAHSIICSPVPKSIPRASA